MNQKNLKFGKEMESRTKDFTVSTYKLAQLFPLNDSARDIKRQLFRSASSVGASYREGNRSRSKADFKSRIKICESEASETVYWLEVTPDLHLIRKEPLKEAMKEANELLAIFSTISKKLQLSN